jgi:hypothetical protein
MDAKAILKPKSARPVIQGIKSRKAWLEIKQRYRALMETKTSGEAIYQLTSDSFPKKEFGPLRFNRLQSQYHGRRHTLQKIDRPLVAKFVSGQ